MEDERTQEVGRYAETLDDIITADHSFGDDFLLPDMYDMCGASTSSSAFLDATSDGTPLGSLDGAFMESYDALLCSDRFHPAVSCGTDPAPLRGRSNSAFVEWKTNNNADFLQPKKRQGLLKRCIRLLKDIDGHKIVRPLVQSRETDSTGSNYDKLAIHHVVAERRRREQMNEIFSALRTLIPACPKKGRATVLQHTKEYVIQLKSRIEELERRNRDLEELLGAQRSLISFANKPASGRD